MIKDKGRDFSRSQTTLVCMGGCCCCCCLQSMVAAYFFAKAGNQTATECLDKMGPVARTMTFISPAVGIMMVAYYVMNKGGNGGAGLAAIGLMIVSPLIMTFLGVITWIGAAVGTLIDTIAFRTSGVDRLDNLELFGNILFTASISSIAYGIPAFLLSIPILVLFISPIAWSIMPVLIIAATGYGWNSVNE